MDKTTQTQIIKLIHQEVIPAIGCTEPVAVALAAAKAAEVLGCKPEKTEVFLSANILKNAMRPYTKKFNFPYWNEIDYRSIENFVFGTNVRKEGMPFHFGTKHTALDDSISQAIALCYIYQWRREVDQAYGGGARTRGG